MCNRQSYLATLRRELTALPAPVVDDILWDFDAHFREALAAGRSEPQAAARLGDPVLLAGALVSACGLAI